MVMTQPGVYDDCYPSASEPGYYIVLVALSMVSARIDYRWYPTRGSRLFSQHIFATNAALEKIQEDWQDAYHSQAIAAAEFID